MKVKNIDGSSDNTCKCGSWLNHWKKFSRAKAGLCKERSCTNLATVGAHVRKANSKDQNGYIIPLCSAHNELKGKELEIFLNPTLISANVSETCGKVIRVNRMEPIVETPIF